LSLALYFLPTIIALLRGHRVVALVWSATR
jgi:hypothetical protein